MITQTLPTQDAATQDEPIVPENGYDSAQDFSGPIRCAVIGSQPSSQHDWLRLSLNEFTNQGTYSPPTVILGNEIEAELIQHRQRNIKLQTEAGLDLFSEGELFRTGKEGVSSSYILYIAQFMDGIRRTGTVQGERDSSLLIDAPLRRIDTRIICDDWAQAQALTDRPVKINLPGPITFASRVPSSHYHSHEQLARDYARLLGAQLAALESAGCKWAQIDDPHIIWHSREYPYGVECLDEALTFTSGKMKSVVHMCQQGNPYSFIEDSSPARGNIYYGSVAPQLAQSRVDAIAVEKPNIPGLKEFNLGLFGEKTIFLGLVDVADSIVESPSQIADDIIQALKEVPAHNLIITPDCGIKHFPEQLALQKLQSMRQAVDAVNTEITKISHKQ